MGKGRRQRVRGQRVKPSQTVEASGRVDVTTTSKVPARVDVPLATKTRELLGSTLALPWNVRNCFWVTWQERVLWSEDRVSALGLVSDATTGA